MIWKEINKQKYASDTGIEIYSISKEKIGIEIVGKVFEVYCEYLGDGKFALDRSSITLNGATVEFDSFKSEVGEISEGLDALLGNFTWD